MQKHSTMLQDTELLKCIFLTTPSPSIHPSQLDSCLIATNLFTKSTNHYVNISLDDKTIHILYLTLFKLIFSCIWQIFITYVSFSFPISLYTCFHFLHECLHWKKNSGKLLLKIKLFYVCASPQCEWVCACVKVRDKATGSRTLNKTHHRHEWECKIVIKLIILKLQNISLA